jgi:hypothetical protein
MTSGTLLLAVGVAWLGFELHNVADLPDQSLLSPESLYPTLVYLVLAVLLRWTAWPMFGWALLNLVGGGIVSVLPLSFLPFDPEQTLRHYSFHLIYALSQAPLVWLTFRAARRPTTT